jgi:transposase-like protein
MRAGENISALARDLGVRRKLLYEWKQAIQEGAQLRKRGRPRQNPPQEKVELPSQADQKIRDLQMLVGQLTEENRFFRAALRRVEDLHRKAEGDSARPSLPRSKR